jgi:hypothetical protein
MCLKNEGLEIEGWKKFNFFWGGEKTTFIKCFH